MTKLENTITESNLFFAKYGRFMTDSEWDQFELDGNWNFMDSSIEALIIKLKAIGELREIQS